jgi:hypothetical protein
MIQQFDVSHCNSVFIFAGSVLFIRECGFPKTASEIIRRKSVFVKKK